MQVRKKNGDRRESKEGEGRPKGGRREGGERKKGERRRVLPENRFGVLVITHVRFYMGTWMQCEKKNGGKGRAKEKGEGSREGHTGG
jgi:hypothetical protein